MSSFPKWLRLRFPPVSVVSARFRGQQLLLRSPLSAHYLPMTPRSPRETSDETFVRMIGSLIPPGEAR